MFYCIESFKIRGGIEGISHWPAGLVDHHFYMPSPESMSRDLKRHIKKIQNQVCRFKFKNDDYKVITVLHEKYNIMAL